MFSDQLKILVVPDSFKGSATSVEVVEAVIQGIRRVYPLASFQGVPLADGGEGSLDAIHAAMGGVWNHLPATDPLGRKIQARYLMVDNVAFIELAEASGLQFVEAQERNARLTSTKGTGTLMQDAINKGATEMVLCIGGSATNDGGTGIACALGFEFINAEGKRFLPVGGNLSKIVEIRDPSPRNVPPITVLCDVDNPFTGPNGATMIYGPQKGASGDALDEIENGMIHLKDLISAQYRINLDNVVGAGAAGGVGGGMVAFFGAHLRSGVDFLIDRLDLSTKIVEVDLVITGEGQVDSQTKNGKLISGIAEVARKHETPVIAICGSMALDSGDIEELGLLAAFSIQQGIFTWDEVRGRTASDITTTMEQIMRVLKYSSNGW